MALITDVLQYGTGSHPTTSEAANFYATDLLTDGIIGTVANSSGVAPSTGGLAVNATGTPDTNVQVTAGVAYISATPTGQASQRLRIKLTATATQAISANVTGSTRYDWLYVKIDPTNAANVNTAGDNAASLVVSRSTSASTDDGTPPSYGYCIAVITVVNGWTTITNGTITDHRTQTGVTASSANIATTGWSPLSYTPNTVTALGNRSYNIVFNSVDLTSTLSPGMRLKLTRTVSAPTQSTSLNGTTQYYSKSSPAAMTFTDDFTVSAWVKLNSAGANGVIASRYNGTSGWYLYLNTSGQIVMTGNNAGAGNLSSVTSSRSIPVGRWVHVAAQLDMSTFTATTTTSYVMVDGLDVVVAVSRSGTNPTALVQAGNLEIGSNNGGSNFFPGKIAQVAIYNAKVTQATILASMNQTLSGAETSLISAYSFNNSINDLSANANNLSAQASAAATNADSPFGAQGDGNISATLEYGIVTKTAFSTNTTVTVQVPEGGAIPASGGVSAVSYSSQKVPYLFPGDRGKWGVDVIYDKAAERTQSSPTAAVWYNPTGLTGFLPIGAWDVTRVTLGKFVKATTTCQLSTSLSTSASAESNDKLTTYYDTVHSANFAQMVVPHNITTPGAFNVTSQTQVYLIAMTGQATATSIGFGTGTPSNAPSVVTAIPAYL